MNTSAWLVLVCGLTLLHLTAAASAQSGARQDFRASLEVRSGTTFTGTTDASGRLLGLVYDTGDERSPTSWTTRVTEARLRIVNFPYTTAGANGGPTDGQTVRTPMPEEVLTDAPFSGLIRLETESGNGSLRILPSDRNGTVDFNVNCTCGLSISSPRDLNGLNRRDSLGILNSDFQRPLYPFGHAGTINFPQAPTLHIAGPSLVFLYGGVFDVSSSGNQKTTIRTGEHLNASRTVTDPSQTYGTWYYDRTVIILEGREVATEFRPADPGRLLLAPVSLGGSWNGDFEFAGASGLVEVNRSPVDRDHSLLQIIGDVDTQAEYEGETARWTIAGSATYVGFDGATAYGSRFNRLGDLALSTAASVGLLAALLLAFRSLPALLGFFFSRLHPERLLSDPTRSAILEFVASRPGLTLRDVATITGRSYGIVRYHSRILAHGGRLKLLARGKAVHLYPPDHSLSQAERFLALETDTPVRFLTDLVRPQSRLQSDVEAQLRGSFGLTRAGAWKVIRRALHVGLLARKQTEAGYQLSLNADPAPEPVD